MRKLPERRQGLTKFVTQVTRLVAQRIERTLITLSYFFLDAWHMAC
jgi:hypothetical protein